MAIAALLFFMNTLYAAPGSKSLNFYGIFAQNEINPDERLSLHVINYSQEATSVYGSLQADDGSILFENQLLIETLNPFQSVILSPDDLKTFMSNQSWSGSAVLSLVAEQNIEGFIFLHKPNPAIEGEEYRVNLSEVVTAQADGKGQFVTWVYNIPPVDDPKSLDLKITNTAGIAGTVYGTLYNPEGVPFFFELPQPGTAILNPRQTVHLSSQFLQSLGNEAISWNGGASLKITSAMPITVMSLLRHQENGVVINTSRASESIPVANISGDANFPKMGFKARISYIPNPNESEQTVVHITNKSDKETAILGTLYAESGVAIVENQVLVEKLAPYQTVQLFASDFDNIPKTQAWSNSGVSTWEGSANLSLFAEQPFAAMGLLQAQESGQVVNISTVMRSAEEVCLTDNLGLVWDLLWSGNRFSGQVTHPFGHSWTVEGSLAPDNELVLNLAEGNQFCETAQLQSKLLNATYPMTTEAGSLETGCGFSINPVWLEACLSNQMRNIRSLDISSRKIRSNTRESTDEMNTVCTLYIRPDTNIMITNTSKQTVELSGILQQSDGNNIDSGLNEIINPNETVIRKVEEELSDTHSTRNNWLLYLPAILAGSQGVESSTNCSASSSTDCSALNDWLLYLPAILTGSQGVESSADGLEILSLDSSSTNTSTGVSGNGCE